MRKVVYTVKTATHSYRTTDYNLVKNFPQSAYTVELQEVKPEESEKQKAERLERMKRKLDAIALHR